MVLRVSPHQALGAGGLELAVPGVKVAVGRKDQVGVVERARGGVALGNAHAHPGTRFSRRGCYGLGLRAAYHNRTVVVALPQLLAAAFAGAYHKAKGQTVRVAGNEELRQHNEVAWALLRHAVDGAKCPGQAGIAVERLRPRLCHGNLARALDVSHWCLRTGVGYMAETIVVPRRAPD